MFKVLGFKWPSTNEAEASLVLDGYKQEVAEMDQFETRESVAVDSEEEHAAISISYSDSSQNAELFQLTKYGLVSLLLGILAMAGMAQFT